MFDADSPKTAERQDEYDRSPFANGLARCIAALPAGECFIVGVHGPWGDGKTTTLRFVEAALKQRYGLSVQWFNPWRIGGGDELLFEFFHTLAAAGKAALQSRPEQVVAAIAKYARVLSPLGAASALAANAIAPGAGAAVDGAKVVDGAAQWAELFSHPPLEKQRERLIAALKKSGKPLVVFVDDIDRLTADECADVFRLIKACADFPNVVYVLAFDRDHVAEVLGSHLTTGGKDNGNRFLEKIVQVSLSLPAASQKSLERVCRRRVHLLLKSHKVKLSAEDAERWDRAMSHGIVPALRTPRHIQQYVNALSFAVPLLAREANPVDVLVVEALRIFFPTIYEQIKRNLPRMLGLHSRPQTMGYQNTGLPDPIGTAKAKIDHRNGQAIDILVETLFPLFTDEGIYINPSRGMWEQFARDRRICEPSYAPRYFMYGVGVSDVADTGITSIFEAANAGQSDRLNVLLKEHTEELQQHIMLHKLTVRLKEANQAGGATLAVGLAALSNHLLPPVGLFDEHNPGIMAARLAAALVERSGTRRAALAVEVLSRAESVWFAGAFMRAVDRPQFGDGIAHVRRAFAEQMQAFTRSGEPLTDGKSQWKIDLLFPWAKAAGRAAVHEYLASNLGHQLVHVLAVFKGVAIQDERDTSKPPGGVAMASAYFERLALIMDVDNMFGRIQTWFGKDVQTGPEGWAMMNERDLLRAQFWTGYHTWKATRKSLD
ncbi:MAG: P-loop NTPase fold protein [Phycisphaerales bacterium]